MFDHLFADPFQFLLHGPVDRDLPGFDPLDHLHIIVGQQPFVVGLVVLVIDDRAGFESLHEQAGGRLIDGQILGAAHGGHALAFQPVGGGVEEGVGHLLVVDALELAEEADLVSPALVVIVIDKGVAAADHGVTALGQKEGHRAVAEEEVLRLEKAGDAQHLEAEILVIEEGDESGILFIVLPVEIDEFLQQTPVPGRLVGKLDNVEGQVIHRYSG